jgi:hypothetical protein
MVKTGWDTITSILLDPESYFDRLRREPAQVHRELTGVHPSTLARALVLAQALLLHQTLTSVYEALHDRIDELSYTDLTRLYIKGSEILRAMLTELEAMPPDQPVAEDRDAMSPELYAILRKLAASPFEAPTPSPA